MSDKNDYSKAVNKLTSFRSSTSDLFEGQMELIQAILDFVEPLHDRSFESLSDIEKGQVLFYRSLVPKLKKCLDISSVFDESLTKDYAEALTLLSKMHGGSSNV